MKTIAVLITVFNRKNTTLRCLARLYNQLPLDGFDVDVYLTDDGCTDGTPEAVASLFPKVNVIHGKGDLYWNRGMWTAWNTAVETKCYNYYLWINDDTFVYDNMLATLLIVANKTGDEAIIVGATQATDHSCLTYGGRIRSGEIPQPNGDIMPVDFFNGNIVLVPQKVYAVLGNLDYYFTHSKGDFDYGMRANKAGIKIYQAGCVLGECDNHQVIDKWCNPSVPLVLRWRMMHRPNGMPPKETFHLERRHYGLVKACFHYFTIYVRCLMPWLWKK